MLFFRRSLGLPRFYEEVFPRICVTDLESVREINHVVNRGFTAVLNVSEFDIARAVKGKVEYCHIELVDGVGCDAARFHEAYRKLDEWWSMGHRVVVNCHAGISRSPSVVAVYMYMRRTGELRRIADARGKLAVPDGFVETHRFLKDEMEAVREGIPAPMYNDRFFRGCAAAFQAMSYIRPWVLMRPSMWVDLYPRLKPFIDAETSPPEF